MTLSEKLSSAIFLTGSLILVIYLYIIIRRLARLTTNLDKNAFCPECARWEGRLNSMFERENTRTCPICGFKQTIPTEQI